MTLQSRDASITNTIGNDNLLAFTLRQLSISMMHIQVLFFDDRKKQMKANISFCLHRSVCTYKGMWFLSLCWGPLGPPWSPQSMYDLSHSMIEVIDVAPITSKPSCPSRPYIWCMSPSLSADGERLRSNTWCPLVLRRQACQSHLPFTSVIIINECQRASLHTCPICLIALRNVLMHARIQHVLLGSYLCA